MSFDFSAGGIPPQIKAQATYKDGGGMGGGGMYFKQDKKRKDQPEEDMFEFSKDEETDILFGSEPGEDEIPADNLFNKFVNWFRPKH